MHEEEWRPIPSFEDYYEVSNMGQVRRSHPAKNTFSGRILKPQPVCRGSRRQMVSLSINGTVHPMLVAKAVAAAFIGPREPWQTINHKDGDCSNNRLDNLEYISLADNLRHAHHLGLMQPKRGVDHHKAKLSVEQVIVIHHCAAPTRMIARVFGLNSKTVRQIKRGDIWKHLFS